MSEEIKVSEMQEAEEVNDEDIVMVIQKKVNKKAKIKQIKNELAVSPTQPTTNEKVWFKCGKNKFDSDELSSKTALGITTSFSNSIMTINGTSTGNGIMYAQSLTKIVLEAGTYTWSMNKKSGTVTRTTQAAALYLRKSETTTNIATISAETFATTDTKSVTFTLTERTAIDFYAYVNATGLAFNNLALEVQIERGSAATTYEEYVEPTVYVKNASGVFEEFYNKNFFKTEKLVITSKLSGFNVTGYRFGKLCFIFFDGAAENLSQTWTPYKLCEITGVTAAGAISSTFVNQVGQSGDVTILSESNVINLNYRSVTPVTKNSWIRGQLLFVCK